MVKQNPLFDALDDAGVETDLFQLFLRPIEEMTGDEIDNVYEYVRQQRKVKVKRTRKQTKLDFILKNMDEETAQAILKQLTDEGNVKDKDRDKSK